METNYQVLELDFGFRISLAGSLVFVYSFLSGVLLGSSQFFWELGISIHLSYLLVFLTKSNFILMILVFHFVLFYFKY